MGRLRKQTAEYFPHFVGDSRTKFVLENTWGNDGYAFWFKLLELLCRSDGHFYDCSQAADMKYLTALAKVTNEVATDILQELADMGKIDAQLWSERKIIWCQTLVDNLAGMYAKRTTPIPNRPFTEEVKEEAPQERPEAAQAAKTDETVKSKGRGRKKATEKPAAPKKVQYAEFVSLTEAEYDKLVAQHGAEKTKRMIEVLDNYKGANNKKYASDYRAILNWVVERVNEEYSKRGGYGNGTDINRGNPAPAAGGFKPSGGFRGSGT